VNAGGKEFGAVVGCLASEDSIDRMNQFSCDGQESLEPSFVASHTRFCGAVDGVVS
jgi:hypothetical protein